ncbi:MAG: DHH family phosphoesterase [Candidatus Omnitrophota bacterium]
MTSPSKGLIAQKARRLLRFLTRKKEQISPLLILTHNHPDPDAIATAYALQYIGRQVFGISSQIVYAGIIGRMENKEMVRILKIPLKKIRPYDFRKFRNVALVDTQPAFENNIFPKNRRATLIVDQHPCVEKPVADLALIDTDMGATSVLLAKALLMLEIEIPSSLATALVYGILSDTLNLYRANSPEILDTYLRILSHSDLVALSRIQNPSRSKAFFLILARGIQKAMVKSRLIVAHLGTVDSPDFVSQIADYLITYKRMQWSFCTGRHRGKLYASLRMAKPRGNAAEILRDVFVDKGQAGGHGSIAGGSLRVEEPGREASWEEAEQALLSRLLKRIRVPAKKDFYFPFRDRPADDPKIDPAA